jgi:hypothetical protein
VEGAAVKVKLPFFILRGLDLDTLILLHQREEALLRKAMR